MGRLYPISLSDYDSNMPMLIQMEKNKLKEIFSANLRIEHIGSTTIPGIQSKSTIDIFIEKPSLNGGRIIQKMTTHGYKHMLQQSRHLMFVSGYSASGTEKES